MAEDLTRYQIKSITPVDEYECTLSEEVEKIAQEELRENSEIRAHGIKVLRDWTMENPRIIKSRLDSRFLVKALRFRKYSIPMTQEMIERYLLFREGLYGYDWFSNLDPMRPHLITLLERGLIFPLPKRDKHGRRVILLKLSELDTSFPKAGCLLLTLLTLTMEILVQDEENQIRGLSYIADFKGMTVKQALVFPLEAWFKFGKNAEKTCAVRHKAFNVVNLPQSLLFFINFGIKHMPEKLQTRVKFFSCPIAETGLVELDNLPIEHGGTIPMKEITDDWKKILLSYRQHFLNYNDMAIDRKMYTKDVLDCSPETLKTPLILMDLSANKNNYDNLLESSVQGSFRRLEID